jgi:hypothetical protein
MSAENLASASSAFANFREPVHPSYQCSRLEVVHIAALTHKYEHIWRHRELVHSVHSQTYGLLANGVRSNIQCITLVGASDKN